MLPENIIGLLMHKRSFYAVSGVCITYFSAIQCYECLFCGDNGADKQYSRNVSDIVDCGALVTTCTKTLSTVDTSVTKPLTTGEFPAEK